jgi:hypothetical protein
MVVCLEPRGGGESKKVGPSKRGAPRRPARTYFHKKPHHRGFILLCTTIMVDSSWS